MLQARPAEREDFASIARMPLNPLELFYMYPKGVFPVSPDELAEVAASRSSPTVVLADGAVAGYGNLYDVERGRHGWLGNVIVHPDYRRHGIGAFLIETMGTIAREKYGAEELRLVCHNTNTKAMLLYGRMGFKPFDMQQTTDYNGDTVVGIRMFVRLDATDAHRKSEE